MSLTARSPWAVVADLMYPQPDPYEHDSIGWVNDVLDEFMWSKQLEVAAALVKHRYVAVKSCHGSGKSHSSPLYCSWPCRRHLSRTHCHALGYG